MTYSDRRRLATRHQRVVVADDDLRETGAVANVDEGHAAEIADAVHPAEQRRRRRRRRPPAARRRYVFA